MGGIFDIYFFTIHFFRNCFPLSVTANKKKSFQISVPNEQVCLLSEKQARAREKRNTPRHRTRFFSLHYLASAVTCVTLHPVRRKGKRRWKAKRQLVDRVAINKRTPVVFTFFSRHDHHHTRTHITKEEGDLFMNGDAWYFEANSRVSAEGRGGGPFLLGSSHGSCLIIETEVVL